MIGTLVARNLKHQRRLLLAGLAGLVAFETLLCWAASQIDRNVGLRALMQLMPPSIQSLMPAEASFVSFPGAVAFGFTHPVALAISFALVLAAATTPAAEHESGFLDLVVARPVSRTTYLAATLLGVARAAVAAPIALLIGAAIGIAVAASPTALPWTAYIPGALELSALLLAGGGLSLAISAGAARRGPAMARSVAILLACFFLDFLAGIRPELRTLGALSLFHYFRPVAAAVNGEPPLGGCAVLLAVCGVATAIAFVRFARRDL
ncbi:MAG: ABC transporter permease subunit [Acidobacteria bacterium]|nr:ABC transporter permease subunit [Acidobacteriota bacterium]